MLKCKDVAERASALIDGELTGWQATQMRLHLAMCKGCDAFVRQMRTTMQLTRAAAQGEADAPADSDALDAILARTALGKRPRG